MSEIASTTGILSQLVQRARGIYSLPAVAMKVIELTDQATVDANEIKDCIQNDPALVAKILRVANSSLFGLSREVSDLNQALALLGTKPLKMLVLGFSLPRALFDGLETDVLTRYWRHTLIKAIATRELAERFWNASGEDAFVAGLLQDIGQLALIQDLGESYITFLNQVYEDNGDLLDLEEETLGFDHTLFSGRLLDHWGLPKSIVDAVGAPRNPDELLRWHVDSRAIAQIVYVAELLAQVLTRDRPATLAKMLDAMKLFCGQDHEPLNGIVDELAKKVNELADVLSVNVPGDEDYRQILADAHDRLSLLVEEANSRNMPLASVSNSASRPTFSTELQSDPVCNQSVAIAERPSVESYELVLSTRLNVAVNSCRQARCAVSLMFVEVDQTQDASGFDLFSAAAQLGRHLEAAIERVVDPGDICLSCGEERFALILEDCDRAQAVEMARHLIEEMRVESHKRLATGNQAMTVSIGLAAVSIPAINFDVNELVDAAERCMYGAKTCGGDSFKSIDL